MMNLLFIEPVHAHYRKDFYDILLNDKEFNIKILAGDNYEGIKSISSDDLDKSDYASFKIFNHKFYYLKRSVRYIKKEDPDVIVCSGIDFHLIHTFFIYISIRIFQSKKFYWWSHAGYGNQGKIGKFIRKLFYKCSSGVFVYSQEGRKNLLDLGIEDSKIKVVNNAINYEDYGFINYDLIANKKNNIFTILYSGRINKAKKVHVLVEALAILKKKSNLEFKCVLVGDGDLKELINLSSKYNVSDKIQFVGAKYGKEAHQYFLESDLFVYPGGIGLSALHALSFGLPIITTDYVNEHGPEFELLKKEYNGDLYIDNLPEDLTNKIINWQKKIIKDHPTYIKNCIGIVNEMEYLPEKVAENFIEHLRKNHK